MKKRKDIDQTQFTDIDISGGYVSNMGSSETIVEYSDIDPTMPYTETPEEKNGGYEVEATEMEEEGVTVVDDRFAVKAPGSGPRHVLPVVGWLACVNGPCAGMDYRLHANYNKIGRNAALDINIEDPKFSKNPVAWVGYFSETNEYYVGAESSTNVLYVNGIPLPAGQSRQFFAWDRVRMGDTELLFMPLCGEKFTWGKANEGES